MPGLHLRLQRSLSAVPTTASDASGASNTAGAHTNSVATGSASLPLNLAIRDRRLVSGQLLRRA